MSSRIWKLNHTLLKNTGHRGTERELPKAQEGERGCAGCAPDPEYSPPALAGSRWWCGRGRDVGPRCTRRGRDARGPAVREP